jgi:hypothetical protein
LRLFALESKASGPKEADLISEFFLSNLKVVSQPRDDKVGKRLASRGKNEIASR